MQRGKNGRKIFPSPKTCGKKLPYDQIPARREYLRKKRSRYTGWLKKSKLLTQYSSLLFFEPPCRQTEKYVN